MDNRKCIICGKEFMPTHTTQQCCCQKCAAILRGRNRKTERIIKYCEVCGKEMYLKPSKANTKYCCRECAEKGRTTQVKKICEYCGKEYYVIKSREKITKYCSRECSDKAKEGKPNCICTQCGKPFHMKPYLQNKYERHLGYFCCTECFNKYKETAYSGAGNHQYGLKGPLNDNFKGNIIPQKNHKLIEQMVYCPEHPFCTKNGRVKQHRLIVEQNYQLFDEKYFVIINSKHYLLPKIDVHHKDGDHNNNALENLVPCTKSEHRKYHNSTNANRNIKGQIIKTTAVLKQGELLENPEVGNQQPSIRLKTNEGSETRC